MIDCHPDKLAKRRLIGHHPHLCFRLSVAAKPLTKLNYLNSRQDKKMNMKKMSALSLASLIAMCAVSATAQELTKPKSTPAKTVAATTPASKAMPTWTVVDEEFWFPLRYEPMRSFDSARYDYRRSEEKSAAREINKAVSWLGWAERHAMPETKAKLADAASDLKAVSNDLQAGDTFAAEKMEASLSKAASALSEWHYYRAKDWWGKHEAKYAGEDLVLAANYLQRAADSAHYQFGPDTQVVVSDVFRNGKWINDETHTNHNWIAKNIEGVEAGLREVAASMTK